MLNSGISVIIPVYNAEQYIESCLGSICEQTMTDLEIICINDGSTDGSLSKLQRIAQKDKRIKIVDIPNGGASKARNMGINLSTKKYLTFVDADDTIEPQMYDTLYQMAENNDLDCACCGFKVFPIGGEI